MDGVNPIPPVMGLTPEVAVVGFDGLTPEVAVVGFDGLTPEVAVDPMSRGYTAGVGASGRLAGSVGRGIGCTLGASGRFGSSGLLGGSGLG